MSLSQAPRGFALKLLSVLTLVIFNYPSAYALNPQKRLTQYSKAVWTQQQGLPQDTVRAISQTDDGFLWIGTNEGLARFDGFEFATFTKDDSELPAGSINSLAAGPDGSLWIATTKGLATYHSGRISRIEGLPMESVSSVIVDTDGRICIVASGDIHCLTGGQVRTYAAGRDVPIDAVRALTVDSEHRLYAVGWTAVARFENGKFVRIAGADLFGANLPQNMIVDRHQGLWVLGTRGLVHRDRDGSAKTYRSREGLSDSFGVNAILEDGAGNIWAGTDNGLARLEKGRFETRVEPGVQTRGSVTALFEDREGNLWVGGDAGLMRLRDDVFTVYGKPEGLQSNEPDTLFQDRSGRVWAGFSDGGLAVVEGHPLSQALRAQLPKGRVFSIRESRSHELIVAGRDGLVRIQNDRIRKYVPDDPVGRKSAYDAIESADGRLWLALPNGLAALEGSTLRWLLNAGTSRSAYPLVLAESRDGSIWAGTEGEGLWRVSGTIGKEETRLYTTADGLGSDSIRSLYEDPEGTLWISTLGGGLNAYRDGKFRKITAREGLPSDNVTNVIDDGQSLWLSTPRGIAAVQKSQLEDFLRGRVGSLQPTVYGLADGLRSAEPPTLGSGGIYNRDGSIWFATNGGIAVFREATSRGKELAPLVHILDLRVGDRYVDTGQKLEWDPTLGTPVIRYTAVHLSAPFQVQFLHKLDGLDPDWVNAGARRIVPYARLSHGTYTFHVKARLPGGAETEKSLTFTVLPRYYETSWFRLLCVSGLAWMGWAGYRLRVRQVQARFQTVLDERARLAREVHDTLAQGFVGISTQLAVVESHLAPEDVPGRQSLDIAKRMVQYSLAEARRSVMDLRAAALDDTDLGGALRLGAHQWTAGSSLNVKTQIVGDASSLPEKVAHHVLRMAQEAVNNVVKHAAASTVEVSLTVEPKQLELRIQDDGRGFDPEGMLLSSQANFGLMGMRERAERLGGEFVLRSRRGHGTELSCVVPLKP